VPEQTPATPARAQQLYEQTGVLEKTSGSCARASGIGSAACVYTGSGSNGTVLAVQGHLILELSFLLAFPHVRTDTVARVHAQEQRLARKVLSRAALAHR
jgi:hypothetical protein